MPPEPAWFGEPPPWWYRLAQAVLFWMTVLVLSATIMLQWGLWTVVTGNMLQPWGVVIGVVIAAAQICALFCGRSRSVAL